MTRLKDLLDYLDYLDSCSDNQFLKFCDAMEKRGYQFVTQHVLDYDYPHVTHCKDCKHFEYDHIDAVYFPTETGEAERVPLITAHEICTRWGDGCKTDQNGFCFMAERKEE